MPLAGIGNEYKGAAGAQLEMRDLNAPIDATDDQPFFAPVELEGFAQGEFERDVGGFASCLPGVFAPAPDKFSDPAVAAGEAFGADFLPEL